MALPEYVTPVLAASGTVAVLFVVFRYGLDAVVRLLAGVAAIFTGDEKRAERCIELVRVLRNRDKQRYPPPSLPSGDGSGRL
jgi:hypothetical protein